MNPISKIPLVSRNPNERLRNRGPKSHVALGAAVADDHAVPGLRSRMIVKTVIGGLARVRTTGIDGVALGRTTGIAGKGTVIAAVIRQGEIDRTGVIRMTDEIDSVHPGVHPPDGNRIRQTIKAVGTATQIENAGRRIFQVGRPPFAMSWTKI